MFDFKNKKSRICFVGMLISLAILLIVFYATDGLLGDKEFSEYTYDDWSIAILPLSIIIVSAIPTLVFALVTFLFFKKKVVDNHRDLWYNKSTKNKGGHSRMTNNENTNKQTDSAKPLRVPTESRRKNAGTAVKWRRSR